MSVTQGAFDSVLSDFFTANSRVIAHGRNIVNVIIVDFRGFDTMGEISVVMITALAVFTLTRGTARQFRAKRQGPEDSGAMLESAESDSLTEGADQ